MPDAATDASSQKPPQVAHHHAPSPDIDAGLRQWYDACPCCMSQALPEVKQALDEEKAASST